MEEAARLHREALKQSATDPTTGVDYLTTCCFLLLLCLLLVLPRSSGCDYPDDWTEQQWQEEEAGGQHRPQDDPQEEDEGELVLLEYRNSLPQVGSINIDQLFKEFRGQSDIQITRDM